MLTRHILFVADRTAADPNVRAALLARAAGTPTVVTLLVPATPRRSGWTWDESVARGEARRRMDAAVASLRSAGIAVTAVLGDFRPMDAIRDEMRRRHYDEIVISTLPTTVSRWLRADLPARVAREFTISVTHVQAGAGSINIAPARQNRPAA